MSKIWRSCSSNLDWNWTGRWALMFFVLSRDDRPTDLGVQYFLHCGLSCRCMAGAGWGWHSTVSSGSSTKPVTRINFIDFDVPQSVSTLWVYIRVCIGNITVWGVVRNDLLCVEGIGRAFRVFLGLSPPPHFKLDPLVPSKQFEITVKASVSGLNSNFSNGLWLKQCVYSGLELVFLSLNFLKCVGIDRFGSALLLRGNSSQRYIYSEQLQIVH